MLTQTLSVLRSTVSLLLFTCHETSGLLTVSFYTPTPPLFVLAPASLLLLFLDCSEVSNDYAVRQCLKSADLLSPAYKEYIISLVN